MGVDRGTVGSAFFGATLEFCTHTPWEDGGGPEDDIMKVLSVSKLLDIDESALNEA